MKRRSRLMNLRPVLRRLHIPHRVRLFVRQSLCRQLRPRVLRRLWRLNRVRNLWPVRCRLQTHQSGTFLTLTIC